MIWKKSRYTGSLGRIAHEADKACEDAGRECHAAGDAQRAPPDVRALQKHVDSAKGGRLARGLVGESLHSRRRTWHRVRQLRAKLQVARIVDGRGECGRGSSGDKKVGRLGEGPRNR